MEFLTSLEDQSFYVAKDFEVYPYRIGLAEGVKQPNPTIKRLRDWSAATAAGSAGSMR